MVTLSKASDGKLRAVHYKIEKAESGGRVLLAEFDDGTVAHDALRWADNIADLGLGVSEGTLGGGDSGGPWFVDYAGRKVITAISRSTERYSSLAWGTPDTDFL